MGNELEMRLKDVCKDLVLQLRGNQGEYSNAIELLHSYLDSYKSSIRNDDMVSKELVGILLYTCNRFYVQSKYSKNHKELLKEFDKFNSKLYDIFNVGG
ncbi:hypothetical protein [Paenibacillus sp. LHD-38]|uniref:hypothetical protein n=1 Tax=Paenibacillus sp. LHD-38 TaxID=3072143 RepID=UPI00280CEF93|nr:hypothetical protein [Paenibacillus sp. LHD-38]MDQ8738053.1 hypothetical protein [Paenibacillus sp. LHD-38]